MNTSQPPLRLTDRKRAAIIEAAIEEFLAAGFDATSMDRIAARASVSKRTVYNHFPSKEVLFAAILRQLWESSDTGEAPAYSAAHPLRAQLLQLLFKKLSLLNNEAFLALARVAIAAGIHSPERAREMVTRMGEREEDLTVWIRAAAADGRLKTSDPVYASQQLQALVKAFAFWPQVTMGQPPLGVDEQKHVAESAADMFLARYA
ncbi:TetR/AcrR family transcriptional regulator [Paraburkholderia fungorum]|jgi:TetR/AcrR family transcriptional regulator, regulator of autoinduction and epiphytic fitness|uniref:Bacterial regulatory s, tetR family protein n=1 Tax=Paraburkholderia fungorum TaxID=134537 RepID=A0AAP1PK48_9BURK|nr:TetR/AcrR family transcriptional regulator [Paraburkholderia fungorum]KFX66165.1 TetR family transcriptional regulator [Burkholderia sp. K24]AJZ61756.1 bacterial regulatory s, tetR family protein [Paraburkholderia fungorum]MBB4513428.1 TetR/AcrR family transcriptional regulator of autoinduction and epiphytic fitness [Paraburkholderia fungorum]MBB6200668.1 TetR/AcrR family transcriptional regulator of autoinduction and epiphytic fitness [Paraburkholderia fungorum]MBU7439526.1 TetR/AcrR famil